MGATQGLVRDEPNTTKRRRVKYVGPPDHHTRFIRDDDAPFEIREWIADVSTGTFKEIQKLYAYDHQSKTWDVKPIVEPRDGFARVDFKELMEVFSISVEKRVTLIQAFIDLRGPENFLPRWLKEAAKSPEVYGVTRDGREGYSEL